jgi:hypothetical protein
MLVLEVSDNLEFYVDDIVRYYLRSNNLLRQFEPLFSKLNEKKEFISNNQTPLFTPSVNTNFSINLINKTKIKIRKKNEICHTVA